jgi:hypothetical protein
MNTPGNNSLISAASIAISWAAAGTFFSLREVPLSKLDFAAQESDLAIRQPMEVLARASLLQAADSTQLAECTARVMEPLAAASPAAFQRLMRSISRTPLSSQQWGTAMGAALPPTAK